MGAEGAQRSMGTKSARRKFLSILQPNTILKPTPDPNAHPTLSLNLMKTEYWDRAGGEVGHACNSRKRKKNWCMLNSLSAVLPAW